MTLSHWSNVRWILLVMLMIGSYFFLPRDVSSPLPRGTSFTLWGFVSHPFFDLVVKQTAVIQDGTPWVSNFVCGLLALLPGALVGGGVGCLAAAAEYGIGVRGQKLEMICGGIGVFVLVVAITVFTQRFKSIGAELNRPEAG